MKRSIFVKKMILVLGVLLIFVGCRNEEGPLPREQEEKVDLIDNSYNENQVNQNEQVEANNDLLIKDKLPEIDNTILTEIVVNYFLVFDFDTSFDGEELIDYDNAFKYMMTAGTYPIQPFEYWSIFESYYNSEKAAYIIPIDVVDNLIVEKNMNALWFKDLEIIDDNYVIETADIYMRWSIRPELYEYYNADMETIQVPANVCEKYILSKFNTKIEHSKIKEYDKESDTYIYYPFMGEFYYNVSIDEIVIDGETIKFTSTLINNVDESVNSKYISAFVIKFVEGEYKFISVDTKEKSISMQ